MKLTDEEIEKIKEEVEQLVERLYPPDWNLSEEVFEELLAECIIISTPEGYEQMKKAREQLYLEELKIRQSEGKEL